MNEWNFVVYYYEIILNVMLVWIYRYEIVVFSFGNGFCMLYLMYYVVVECWLLFSLLFNDLVLYWVCSVLDGNILSIFFCKMFRNLEIFLKSKYIIIW